MIIAFNLVMVGGEDIRKKVKTKSKVIEFQILVGSKNCHNRDSQKPCAIKIEQADEKQDN